MYILYITTRYYYNIIRIIVVDKTLIFAGVKCIRTTHTHTHIRYKLIIRVGTPGGDSLSLCVVCTRERVIINTAMYNDALLKSFKRMERNKTQQQQKQKKTVQTLVIILLFAYPSAD